MKEELLPFPVEVLHGEKIKRAEIKPCCKEDNLLYYDVWMEGNFQFTLTADQDAEFPRHGSWKIAMMNADNHVDPQLVQRIGNAIEMHYAY